MIVRISSQVALTNWWGTTTWNPTTCWPLSHCLPLVWCVALSLESSEGSWLDVYPVLCRLSILFTFLSVGSIGTCLAFPSVFVMVCTVRFHTILMPDCVDRAWHIWGWDYFQYQGISEQIDNISRISPNTKFILKTIGLAKSLVIGPIFSCLLPRFEAIHPLKNPDWKLNIEI